MKSLSSRSSKVRRKQEVIVNDAPKLHATFEPGDVAHQGDLIIVCIPRLPASKKPRKDRQLADGSTQGSRHVLERGELYDADPAEVAALIQEATGQTVSPQFVGPVFTAPAFPTENDLTHPEHGNQGFPTGANCAVVYQRNLDAEEREQRSQD
jgi:hypothetical protein